MIELSSSRAAEGNGDRNPCDGRAWEPPLLSAWKTWHGDSELDVPCSNLPCQTHLGYGKALKNALFAGKKVTEQGSSPHPQSPESPKENWTGSVRAGRGTKLPEPQEILFSMPSSPVGASFPALK